MKNSKDPIGNMTQGVPACSAVPQPTAPLRAHQILRKPVSAKSMFFAFHSLHISFIKIM
jgi:hypothetical protein